MRVFRHESVTDTELFTFCRMYCVPGLTIIDFFEPNTSFVELITTHSHPFSRGSIHLNSSDPFIPPLIDLNAWAFDVGTCYIFSMVIILY